MIVLRRRSLACTALAVLSIGVAPLARAQQHRADLSIPSQVFVMRFAGNAPVSAMLMPVALRKSITVQLTKVTIEQALKAIASAADVGLSYNRAEVPVNQIVSVDVRGGSVADALQQVLRGQSLELLVSSTGHMALVPSDLKLTNGSVEQEVIIGKVTHAKTKQPVVNATIMLDDASKGVITGEDGTFRLPASTGEHLVRVRAVGFVKQTARITVTEGQSSALNIALEPSASVLDEVVVTGTVVATARREVPNAMTVITAKELEQRGITQIEQLFRGDIPGIFAQNQGSGNPLDSVFMFSRGATAISSTSVGTWQGTNPIKTYVDGVEMANPSFLSQIDPRSIERIEILSGPQASTIYGSNALNGVMQIFTKRGSTSRPQVVMSLIGGWIQNNFSSALAPVYTADARVSGTNGVWSYSGGGAWDFTGKWTPAKRTERLSADGGGQIRTGNWRGDVSVRGGLTTNWRRGSDSETRAQRAASGITAPSGTIGLSTPANQKLFGQTVGLTIGYTPQPWWSNELILGRDFSNSETVDQLPGFFSPSDTNLSMSTATAVKSSQRFSSSVVVSPTSQSRLTVILGGDHWQAHSATQSVRATNLIGSFTNGSITRARPQKNTGGFLQVQLGLYEAVFLTYGLRAEWNPNYGSEAQPNLAPRYGAAYSIDVGPATVKLRGSYGRSTRPPDGAFKLAQTGEEFYGPLGLWPTFKAKYGDFDFRLANPDLEPEFQQGGEGGIEIYWGNRATLIVTRYNQTVDGLIASVSPIDSVRSLVPCGSSCSAPGIDGHDYLPQNMFLNVAGIRNQGWELQGSVNLGPLTTRGSYSWTKSRSMGASEAYRLRVGGGYERGATFQFLPEHTWSVGMAYALGVTTVNLNVNGTGFMNRQYDELGQLVTGGTRLDYDRPRTRLPSGWKYLGEPYATADLNASRRLSGSAEFRLQVQNLTDRYQNDGTPDRAVMGRQTKVGVRLSY